jgi:choline dehydrogenase-like flavoprotein
MSDFEFKAHLYDDFSDGHWPITYKDLAPYYDMVEKFIGVTGKDEGFEQLPDGIFLPPMEFSEGEKFLVKNTSYPITIGRTAILTKQLKNRKKCTCLEWFL